MFPRYSVWAITKGVHAATWISEPFRKLFDAHIPEWRVDNLYLRYAIGIALPEIESAHVEAKRRLVGEDTEEDENWKIGHPILFPNILRVGHGLEFRVPVDDTHTLHIVHRRLHSLVSPSPSAKARALD